MSKLGKYADPPASLKARIQVVERRMQRRRDSIGLAMQRMAQSAQSQMISPASLITAGLVGVALHRTHRLNGLRILAILQSANTGLRLLLTARPKSSDATH